MVLWCLMCVLLYNLGRRSATIYYMSQYCQWHHLHDVTIIKSRIIVTLWCHDLTGVLTLIGHGSIASGTNQVDKILAPSEIIRPPWYTCKWNQPTNSKKLGQNSHQVAGRDRSASTRYKYQHPPRPFALRSRGPHPTGITCKRNQPTYSKKLGQNSHQVAGRRPPGINISTLWDHSPSHGTGPCPTGITCNWNEPTDKYKY
jgi:hypothetical protein